MFQKLDAVEKRYDELTAKISDPEVIANQSEWQKYMKEHASLVDIVLFYISQKESINSPNEFYSQTLVFE